MSGSASLRPEIFLSLHLLQVCPKHVNVYASMVCPKMKSVTIIGCLRIFVTNVASSKLDVLKDVLKVVPRGVRKDVPRDVQKDVLIVTKN